MSKYSEIIKTVGNQIISKLVSKNNAYGDSVFKPVKVFGESIPASIAIKARISDKLSRIKNRGVTDETEDTLEDLIGYLILLKIILEEEKEKQKPYIISDLSTYYQTTSY